MLRRSAADASTVAGCYISSDYASVSVSSDHDNFMSTEIRALMVQAVWSQT